MVAPRLATFNVTLRAKSGRRDSVWVEVAWRVKAIDAETAKTKIESELKTDVDVKQYEIIDVRKEG